MHEETADIPPAGPISRAAKTAVALHQLYTELKRAGFTEEQALWLVREAMLKSPSK